VEGDEVVFQRRIAEPKLDRAETAGEQPFRLVGEFVRRHQPETAGIVGPDRFGVCTEQRCERQAGRLPQRVPGGDVEARHRHAHDSLHADERESLGETTPQLERSKTLALHHAFDLLKNFCNRRQRAGKYPHTYERPVIPSSVSRSMSNSGAAVMVPRLVPSA
jgi:hypothetical protein